MGIFDELKKLTRPYDDEDDDFIDEGGMGPAPVPERRTNPFSGFGSEQSRPAQGPRPVKQPREGRVVSINPGAGYAQTQLMLVKPERFSSATEIADNLREGRSIIMNLEDTPPEDSRRLLDFLAGVSYALGGKPQRVSKKTYVFAPKNAEISGNILEEMESDGAYL